MNLYDCHNRDRPDENTTHPANNGHKIKLDGDDLVKVILIVNIPFRFSTECKYDKSQQDVRCKGCKHG